MNENDNGNPVVNLSSFHENADSGHNLETGEYNDSLRGEYLWSNANFGEAVSEPMTPLTWSLIQYTLKDWVFVPGYATIGNIGGMPYLNISLFAALFDATGRSRQDLLDNMESTLYMRLPPGVEIPLAPLPRSSILSSVFAYLRIGLRQKRGQRQLPDYLAHNQERCLQFEKRLQNETSRRGLLNFWQESLGPHLQRGAWIVLGAVGNSTDYAMVLKRDLVKLVGPDDANLLIANLSASDELLPSLGPLVGLSQVAAGKLELGTYLVRYGHRGPHEFEVLHPRPIEDPAWLDRRLADFQERPLEVGDLIKMQQEAFEAAWKRLKGRHPGQARSLWRRMKQSARRAYRREQARSEYVRDRWMARKFALQAAKLCGLNDEVFYMSLEELLAFLGGDERVLEYIPARMATRAHYKSLIPYPALICGRFDLSAWADEPERRIDFYDSRAAHPTLSSQESLELHGAAGSTGVVEGQARVLRDPNEGDQLQMGEVLIAVQTDVAWTLLFGRAAAVVTDVGAPLSHAAIVARELGIPAVVGCGNASTRINTGDLVRVDGGRGIVEIIG